MSIPGYAVLRCLPVEQPESAEAWEHDSILVKGGGRDLHLAVGARSRDPESPLLYLVMDDYQHPLLDEILKLPEGYTASEGRSAGGREPPPFFNAAKLRPLAVSPASGFDDLERQIAALVAKAIEAKATMFALGRRFDDQPTDGPFELRADGAPADGGLLFHFPDTNRWAAAFFVASPPAAAPHAPKRVEKKKLVAPTEIPTSRRLAVYAFDPSRGRMLGNVMHVEVPYEPLGPGPVGARVAVIDYDFSNRCFYAPVELDSKPLLVSGGLDPSESDPRFHQQMAYAVVSETLREFEAALGRAVHFRRAGADSIEKLYVYPHAMREANAFYSRDARGLLFGYFPASADAPGKNLPGQTVFTCLSHDIVVHETTHAIVDGVRAYFAEGTNVDVAAFHEGFADVAALFRHLSHREVLLDTIQRTGGMLYRYQLRPEVVPGGASPDAPRPRTADAMAGANPAAIQAEIAPNNALVELAQQFGDAIGRGRGLRSMIGSLPNSNDIGTIVEPHARGAILMAAIFDAFFSIYVRRTKHLFRICRAGGWREDSGDLPDVLARALADEASRAAEHCFGMCVRALDYCPPVDVTFGDYLRALMTADYERFPDDDLDYRDAFMQAFRLRGIRPADAKFFSEDALRWSRNTRPLPRCARLAFGLESLRAPELQGLSPAEKDRNGAVLRAYAEQNAVLLGFEPGSKPEVPSFHPVYRVRPQGGLSIEMVVEMIHSKEVPVSLADPSLGTMPFRDGATVIFDCRGEVRYLITKPDKDRLARQRAHFMRVQGLSLATQRGPGAASSSRLDIDFAALHRESRDE